VDKEKKKQIEELERKTRRPGGKRFLKQLNELKRQKK
jgi:hypothetical protein